MGSCQNSGPHLGPLKTRCRTILRTQKRTLILTTTHMVWLFERSYSTYSRRAVVCNPDIQARGLEGVELSLDVVDAQALFVESCHRREEGHTHIRMYCRQTYIIYLYIYIYTELDMVVYEGLFVVYIYLFINLPI